MSSCSRQTTHRDPRDDSQGSSAETAEKRRADALMWDDTVLVGVAAADRSAKLTNDPFL
jgi:hypothetical protein